MRGLGFRAPLGKGLSFGGTSCHVVLLFGAPILDCTSSSMYV